MPCVYKIIQRRNPRDIEGPKKFYGSKVSLGCVTTKTLAKEIGERAGQSEGAVLGMLRDLQNEVVDLLLQGYSVRLGNIGILYTTLKSDGADTAKGWDLSYLQSVRLRLRPSVELNNSTALDSGNLDFKLYTPISQEEEEEGEI